MIFLHIYNNYGIHTYREIDVATSLTTQVIGSHHELFKRYNEGTLFSLYCMFIIAYNIVMCDCCATKLCPKDHLVDKC